MVIIQKLFYEEINICFSSHSHITSCNVPRLMLFLPSMAKTTH